MTLPEGQLRARRVVPDLGETLATALDDSVTGYLRLESDDALLLDGGGATVLTFEDGVPVAATHTGRDSDGAEALADAAVANLYRLELRTLDRGAMPTFHDAGSARVPPALPAEQLVGDAALAARTREAAPDGRTREGTADAGTLDAVESFLDDEAAIETIRDRARTEARERADEWGFEVADRRE